MPNHPNRNWRARMHEACAAWLVHRSPPPGAVAGLLTVEEVIDLQAEAFRAGYEAGRASRAPKREPTT